MMMLKMLLFSIRLTIMDNITNEYIGGGAQVTRFGEKTLEARQRWFGYVVGNMLGILAAGC